MYLPNQKNAFFASGFKMVDANQGDVEVALLENKLQQPGDESNRQSEMKIRQ